MEKLEKTDLGTDKPSEVPGLDQFSRRIKQVEKVKANDTSYYFDKENFNVIYREYKFVYDYWLIDLDMDVVVHMDYVNEKHIPTDIHYKGFWDVLFFKPERAEFKLKNTNYLVD